MKSTYNKILNNKILESPAEWTKIRTIDMHTGGEPLRVILDGLPKLEGNNVLEYRRYVKENYDYLRRALMFEPRGHADMYGCILLPPNSIYSNFGILFLHNEGYSTMCGHAVIAITKLAVEMGWVEKNNPTTKVVIDAPCGKIESFANIENGNVTSVYFYGVPSFVVKLDQKLDVPGIGEIEYDLAYGGAYYAYVDADKYGISLSMDNCSDLIEKGMAIKRAVISNGNSIKHPYEADLSYLYGTIFIGESSAIGVDSKNVCVFADGEVDRSPTGSGVSGRMAIHYKRKQLTINQEMIIESIIGTTFKGSVERKEKYGEYDAVIPKVEGDAFITGSNEFLIDPKDPLKHGFILR
jgi:trans-L-3-hydroxyproline dehydratase